MKGDERKCFICDVQLWHEDWDEYEDQDGNKICYDCDESVRSSRAVEFATERNENHE